MATNPLLAEINGLSPGAKAALMQAHHAVAPQPLVPNSAPSQLPPSVGPKAPMPDNGPPPTPAGLAPPNSGSMPAAIATPGPNEAKSVIAPPGTIPADTAELARKESTGSGISQIHGMIENSRLGQAHPLLGKILGWGAQIPAQIGDIAASAVAPQVTRLVPGTEYHHDVLVNQDRRQVAADESNAEKEAQTANLQSEPALHQAQLDLKTEHERGLEEHQQDTLDSTLRAHGYKHDEQGNVVPLEYGEMSPQQQAVTDLKGAQEEAQRAQADLKKAQKDNIPTQVAMAQQRLATAQQNANTAIGRLGLQRDEYKANFLGTDANDQALPGAPTDQATGKPMGVRVANAGNPSADRLKRGDLANNVLENTQQIRMLITQNPGLFGAVAGHFTTTQQMIGSDNPAISELGVRIHNAALASNGAHGLRSQEAVADTEHMLLNHFRNSPKATIAGLDALDDSVETFIDAAQQGKRAQPTSDVMKPETSGKAVSLKAAMGLPANKGKSEDQVRQDIKSHGHQVTEDNK